jgi:hypothetical protein
MPTPRELSSPRELGLKSDSFSTTATDGITRRIIANVEAEQKVGKTHFCLDHVPGPVIVYNFDQGLEGVVERMRKTKEIVIAGVPTKERNKIPSYHFGKPIPLAGQGRKDVAYLDRIKKEAGPIWERFINDYAEGLESSARTLVIDTGGGAFALGKLAFHGMAKTTSADDPYGQKGGELKTIFQGLIGDGYSHDKNVLWIHRLKEKWEGGKPSGQWQADGYNQLGYETQVSLRLKKRMYRGEELRSFEVRDCRLDTTLNGERFGEDKPQQYSFAFIAALMTGTDEDDWK